MTDTEPAHGTERRSRFRSWGLYPVAAAVSLVVLLPLSWLVVIGVEVDASQLLDIVVRQRTVDVVVNSLLLTGLVTGFSILLGVPLAYLTTRTDVPFRRFWTVALAMPLVIPSYIGAFALVSAFGSNGLLQSLLEPYGVETLPDVYGLPGTVLVLTLYTYPYVYITTRAALQSLDTRLTDAARTLGHGRLSAFWRVTLPQIRPAIAAGSLLVALYALSDFGTPQFLQYRVFTRQIYLEFRLFGGSINVAAVLSMLLILISVVILAFERRVSGEERVQSSRGHTSHDSPIGLGKWRWPAVIPCALVSGFALLVPLGVLSLWLVRSSGPTYGLEFQFDYVVNSVGLAAAAAAVAAVVGLPIAALSARDDGFLSDLFERASYVGYAVPGIVVGLSLVFLAPRVAPDFYARSIAIPFLLVYAYVVRFLPQAVGSTRASLLRVSPALPEAARSLGRSPLGAFRSITLPLIAPGQIGGAALVFLTVMKELPATLILIRGEYETLTVFIWRATEAAAYGEAAVPALILLVVSGVSMLVILSMEGYHVE